MIVYAFSAVLTVISPITVALWAEEKGGGALFLGFVGTLMGFGHGLALGVCFSLSERGEGRFHESGCGSGGWVIGGGRLRGELCGIDFGLRLSFYYSLDSARDRSWIVDRGTMGRRREGGDGRKKGD